MKTPQKHTFAYSCSKFGSYVFLTLNNMMHLLDIEIIHFSD